MFLEKINLRRGRVFLKMENQKQSQQKLVKKISLQKSFD